MEGVGRNAPAYGVENESVKTAWAALRSASELCGVEDPETEPFRSKYKARDGLKRAKDMLLISESSGDESVKSLLALIDYRLGVICLAVEEPSAARETLDACADVFFSGVVHNVAEAAGIEGDDDVQDETACKSAAEIPVPLECPPGMLAPCPLAWEHPVEAADALTQLGLLWSGRGYPRRSLLYLLASVTFLQDASKLTWQTTHDTDENGQCTAATTITASRTIVITTEKMGMEKAGVVGAEAGSDGSCLSVPHGDARRAERRAKLESQLTHSFYYLAQAYGARDVEQSARYCSRTLQRQLDACQRGLGKSVSFDPGEWSRNACFLADYYAGLDLFPAAGRCLLAAQAVLRGRGVKQAPVPSLTPLKHEVEADNRNKETQQLESAGTPASTTTAPPLAATALVDDYKLHSSSSNSCHADAGHLRGEGTPPLPPPLLMTTPSATMNEPQDTKKTQNADGQGSQAEASGHDLATEAVTGAGEGGRSGMGKGSDKSGVAMDEKAVVVDDLGKGGGGGGEGTGQEQEQADDDDYYYYDDDYDDAQREERLADVERHMAKLYIAVLQRKHNERVLPGGDDMAMRSPIQKGGEEDKLSLGFASLGVGELPMCDPSTIRGDFESIRDVFKKAKSYTDRALRHYVLDGFVTAHVALHQGLSRAYLYLSTFEGDNKRKQAMCTRRAQSLEPLIQVLGPKAYGHLHKELSFELGEIYQDLADLKAARVAEKTEAGGRGATAADVRATEKFLQAAVGYFSHFIAMYHNEGDPSVGVPGDCRTQPRSDMDATEAPGYLHARFMRARLHGKMHFADSAQTLRALRLSRAEFTWLVENSPGHLTAARANDPGFFSQELDLAAEMAQLQDRNIDNLERRHGQRGHQQQQQQ